MLTRKRRWSILIAAALLGLLICGFAAFQYAIHSLKEQVEKTLGPQGEVNEIRISLTGGRNHRFAHQGAGRNERDGLASR